MKDKESVFQNVPVPARLSQARKLAEYLAPWLKAAYVNGGAQ